MNEVEKESKIEGNEKKGFFAEMEKSRWTKIRMVNIVVGEGKRVDSATSFE